MKNKCILFLVVAFCALSVWAEDYELISPNELLKIKLHINNGTQYEIWAGETQLITPSTIGLNLDNGTVIGKGTVKNVERNSVNSIIEVPIGKNKTLDEVYNELTIHFNENYDLVVRAYNEGIAYRFVTTMDGNIIVNSEEAVFNFVGNPTVFFPEVTPDRPGVYNMGHWEKKYTETPLNNITGNRFAVIPVLYSYADSPYRIAITESDTYDYPGMYIQKNGDGSMKGKWVNCYKDEDSVYPYIANVAGSRTFPWRVFIVADNDAKLLNNELVYMLAEPQQITNTDWITPGKTTWEWWHKAMLTPDGKADPTKGIPANSNDNLNFNLFKYYIDFAAANNIQYLTMDAGSGSGYTPRVCSYAKSKGVKVINWTWFDGIIGPGLENWMRDRKNEGLSGFKIDFFPRNDQTAMKWWYEMAKTAAKLEMVINFHGCPVPTGLNRTFPNVLNYEAVLGNEENFWRSGSDPEYHVSYPYIRSLAGPADYTPGSFRNKTKLAFQAIDQPNIVPSSQGTRAHEMAMYVIFDHWLAYLCDAPTEYQKFPDLLDLLATVPATWDKTVPVAGEVGNYIVMAKQTGADWYVGGMTDWDARSIDVRLDFLKPGSSYNAVIVKDGTNANSYPTRYACDTITVTSNDVLSFSMARGGGFMIRLVEAESSSLSEVTSKSSVYFDRASGMLHVKSEEPIQSVAVYNFSGQCLCQKDFADTNSAQRINLSQLNRGAYIVKIRTESAIDSMKFIY